MHLNDLCDRLSPRHHQLQHVCPCIITMATNSLVFNTIEASAWPPIQLFDISAHVPELSTSPTYCLLLPSIHVGSIAVVDARGSMVHLLLLVPLIVGSNLGEKTSLLHPPANSLRQCLLGPRISLTASQLDFNAYKPQPLDWSAGVLDAAFVPFSSLLESLALPLPHTVCSLERRSMCISYTIVCIPIALTTFLV